MNLRLVVEKARGPRQVLRIDRADVVVGRAHSSAVRIPSIEVSRRHCRLRQTHGVVTVEDLDSVNGTFVNGHPVSGPQLVRPGDRLDVGPVTFVVQYDTSEEALQHFEDSGLMDSLDEVLPVEEGAGLVEELKLETVPDDGMPFPGATADETDEEPPAEPSIFDYDESKWEMPREGLRDLLADLDDPDNEADGN
jgi:pSer/pThr/pTyr-binding forkhead associated (FHA) protein